jgi:hypothetical protein
MRIIRPGGCEYRRPAPRGKESNLNLSNSPRQMPSSSAISNISQLRNLAFDEKTSGNDKWLPNRAWARSRAEWPGYLVFQRLNPG